MSVIIEVQPIAEPITVDQVKAELRIDLDNTEDDTLILGYIATAREVGERISNRSLAQKSYLQTFKGFPHYGCELRLYNPPLIYAESIRYLDSNRVWQTWDPDNYEVYRNQEPGVIIPVDSLWPTTAIVPVDTVEVRHWSGYKTDTYGSDGPEIHPDIITGLIKFARVLYDEPDADLMNPKPGTVADSAFKLIRGQKLYA